jgi:ketosteroid isomerase-like protein
MTDATIDGMTQHPDEPRREATRALVLGHVAAFNDHSTERLLAGLSEDVVWVTGQDRVAGQDGVRDLFDDWLWSLDPMLTVRSLVVDRSLAAAELVEELTVDGQRKIMNIAAFFQIRGDRLAQVKVYREGSADIE